MKNLKVFIKIAVSLYSILLFCSCENEYPVYDKDQKDAIYLDYGNNVDSLHLTYGFSPDQSIMLRLPIQIMGARKSVERKYNVEVITDKTTAKEGLHYQIDEETVIEAEALSDTLDIEFFRDKDPLLMESTVVLYLNITESEDLRVVGQKNITISYNNILPEQPWWWSTSQLGPYDYKMCVKFIAYYQAMEESQPYTYNLLKSSYGEYLEKKSWMSFLGSFSNHRIIFYKYVMIPLYDYYQENPDENVDMPFDPRTKI